MYAPGGQVQQRIELVAPECMTLGRALNLDECDRVLHDHVHVRLRRRVFRVIEIEHRDAVPDADGYRRDLAVQRIRGDTPGREPPVDGHRQRDV